jgi:hypothetical protein
MTKKFRALIFSRVGCGNNPGGAAFFIGGALLYVPGLAPPIVQSGIVPGTGPGGIMI